MHTGPFFSSVHRTVWRGFRSATPTEPVRSDIGRRSPGREEEVPRKRAFSRRSVQKAPAFFLHLQRRTAQKFRYDGKENRHRLRPRGLRNEGVPGGLARRQRVRGARFRHPLARKRRLPRLRPSAGRSDRERRNILRHSPLRLGRRNEHDAEQAPGHPRRAGLEPRGRRADPHPQRRQRHRAARPLHRQRPGIGKIPVAGCGA